MEEFSGNESCDAPDDEAPPTQAPWIYLGEEKCRRVHTMSAAAGLERVCGLDSDDCTRRHGKQGKQGKIGCCEAIVDKTPCTDGACNTWISHEDFTNAQDSMREHDTAAVASLAARGREAEDPLEEPVEERLVVETVNSSDSEDEDVEKEQDPSAFGSNIKSPRDFLQKASSLFSQKPAAAPAAIGTVRGSASPKKKKAATVQFLPAAVARKPPPKASQSPKAAPPKATQSPKTAQGLRGRQPPLTLADVGIGAFAVAGRRCCTTHRSNLPPCPL